MDARLLFPLILIAPLALAACPEDDDEKPEDSDPEETSTPEDTGPFEDCQPVTWTDGNSGVYTRDSGGDDHVKHHWFMPADVHKIIATTTWDTDWNMEASLGTGTCPHSGTEYASESNATGTATMELLPSAINEAMEVFDADVKWFSHIGLDMAVGGPEDGETANYTMEVLACTWIQ